MATERARERSDSVDSLYMTPRPAVVGPSKCKVGAIVIAFASLFIIMFVPMGFGPREYKGEQPAQRCAALVMFVAVLWASDAVPSYITSLSVPVIAVMLRVMCVPRDLRLLSETDNLLVPASYCNSTNPLPGHPMHPEQAAVVASGAFFNPVILLFLCGFVMSATLTKFGLSRRLAKLLLARAGTKPGRRLAFVMVLCIVIASVLNNVPAAVLGASLLAPSFAATSKTSWPAFSLIGVAYACNIGGMISPIASPQNVIAIIALATATKGEVSLSFMEWFAVGIPFCAIATVAAWLVLYKFYGKRLPKAMPKGSTMRRMSNLSQVTGGSEEDMLLAGAGAVNPYDIGDVDDMAPPADAVDTAFGESPPMAIRGARQTSDGGSRATVVQLSSSIGRDSEPNVALGVDSSSPLLSADSREHSAARSDSGSGVAAAYGGRAPRAHVPLPTTSAGGAPQLRDRRKAEVAVATGSGAYAGVGTKLTPKVPFPQTRADTVRDVVIVVTIIVTVALWVLFNQISGLFGNIGLIALLPILLFGSLGYLTKQDFNNLSWDTLMLLGGGLSLGTVVDSSGLLLVVGNGMSNLLEGAPVFVVLLAFSTLVAVIANFISSTVSAVLLLPVIATVGVNAGHPRMLVILCVFMTSGAMGLAVSSFPNANSASVRLNGQSLAENKDFIKTGFPVSFVVLVLVNTVGFGLCTLYGF